METRTDGTVSERARARARVRVERVSVALVRSGVSAGRASFVLGSAVGSGARRLREKFIWWRGFMFEFGWRRLRR